MPFYEYRCQECSHLFTLRRPIARRDDPARCPSCESQKVKRMVSAVGTFGGPGEAACRPGFT